MKHVLTDFDLSKEELIDVLDWSSEIKSNPTNYGDVMKNKTLVMLFELSSLRTRISFETAMNQMGGNAIFYSIEDGGFTRSETLSDGVRNLSRYAEFLMVRVLKHEDLERIGKAASIPVINGMTELYHPCQNMADMLTIREKKGRFDGLKLAYVGDGGCNTANSTMIGCSSVGMNVTVVCPDNPSYSPGSELLKKVKEFTGSDLEVTHEVSEGVEDADVIYTDTWVSAGTDKEKTARLQAFPPYQVNMEVVREAKPDCIVMHCLPAHRGYEITSEVMDSDQSVVFDQAENRMHAQKGLLYWLQNF
jgi:ornithine carbamoyltransferase